MNIKIIGLSLVAFLGIGCNATEPEAEEKVKMENIGYFIKVGDAIKSDTLILQGVKFDRDVFQQVPTYKKLIITPWEPYMEHLKFSNDAREPWYREGNCFYTQNTFEQGLGCIPATLVDWEESEIEKVK